MTNKGFGYNPSQQDLGKVEDVNIPSEYIAHPTNIDEWKDLEREVSGYDRPEYETAKYSHTIIASTTDFKLKKNVGRKKGNDAKVYATVEKNMERGFRRGKLPPIVLRGDDGKLQEWLVNGNHRWLWYCRNGHAYFLVDVYDKVEGIDDEDVVDEIGLLFQPQPDGTSSVKDDYVARGRSWVGRRKEAEIPTTQDDVNEWVDKFAKNEASRTRTEIKKAVFNKSVKHEFLTNYLRPNVISFYSERNITILDAGAQIKGTEVHRLYEASQEVFIRDFWPTFVENAADGITTVLNFYLNTSNINDATGIQLCINNRIKSLNEIFDNLDQVDANRFQELGFDPTEIEGSGTALRRFLKFGTRPPQIVDVDNYDTTNSYKVHEPAQGKEDALYKMTYSLLEGNFKRGVAFNFQQASNVVYPVRRTISTFKSKQSFNGTLNRELQRLRSLNLIEFTRKGWYTLR